MQMTLDRFGRMVLPKMIRDHFGLQPGDIIEAEEQSDAIVLRPVMSTDCTRHEGRALIFTGKATGDIGGVLDGIREARLSRVAGKQGA